MRRFTENELQEILRKHKLWVDGKEEGERERAYLSGADLTRAYLSGADLSGANLTGAYLSGADLTGANLTGADLRRANLTRAYLRRADLSGAYMSGAYMSEANLSWAHMNRANLTDANLKGTDLSGACMSGADLSGAYHVPYIPLACPEEGSFIGFKKAILDGCYSKTLIVKLLILEDAKRSSSTSNKCRCSKAKVLDIQDLDGNSLECVACSKYDNTFKYKIGEVVEVKNFDEDRFNECAPGIHFFINRQDAVNY